MAKTGFKPAAGTENLLSKSDSVSREGPLNEVRTDPMVYRVKRKVPVVGYVAGANFLSDRSFNYADIANQIEEYIETTSRDPNAVALIVEGDSMEPQICAGDKIVVAPNSEPRNGKPVVARLAKEGSVVIKIFHRSGPEGKTIRLESRNKEYSDIVKDISEFRFIYPVVKVERDTL
ncbi:MAG TPA: S24 family peptidase [Verrucomicrobiae bacterium]